MKLESNILRALREQKPEFANINEKYLEQVQEHAYHLHATHPLFVKWFSKDDTLGKNEIRVNQRVLQKHEDLAPRLIQIIQLEDGVIGCWEWLTGSDLRYKYRNYLPKAFAKLGNFHKAHRHDQVIYSLITQQAYNTSKELLEAEYKFLCSYHEDEIAKKAKPIFSKLETGFPTNVHGDLHPGNIKLSNGELKFIDWGYSKSSINLFDLSYVETIHCEDSNANEWWVIAPKEAQEVLSAYFGAIGMPVEKIDQIHRAVMLWTKLWAYYNCVRYKNQAEAERCKRNINCILETN